MDILDFFWTFYLNHLSPLWGYFLNFTTLLLIIYSLLQYNVHLCEICCSKYSKVALRFFLNIRQEDENY